MLIIHPDTGDIYYANEAAADFYGYSLAVLENMNIDDINQLSSEEVAAERLKAANEERNFFVFKHRLADGEIRPVHVYSYPVTINDEDYLYSIIIDQTALVAAESRSRWLMIGTLGLITLGIITTTTLLVIIKRLNKNLKESEGRFRALFENSPASIMLHDKDTGEVLTANKAAWEFYGFDSLEEGVQQFIWRSKHKDSSYLYDKVTLHPLVINGQTHVMSVSIDITDMKHKEDEVTHASNHD